VQVLERMIERSDSAAESKERVLEHEFQRAFDLPPEHRARAFPNYFRMRGGRVSIGISLRIRRKRPDLERGGLFYYPLGAANAATGCAIGVSAPFEMNADRSALVDPSINAWNAWLLETAADLVLELLIARWLDSFESTGYLALKGAGHFADLLAERLKTRKCWPARAPCWATSGLRMAASSKLTTAVGRSTGLASWARAAVAAAEQRAVGDHRRDVEGAAVDGWQACMGGLVDVGDDVQQPAARVASRACAGALVAELAENGDERRAGAQRAAGATQPAADGRGRQAGAVGQRAVPDAAGGAEQRGADRRDDIAAVGQQEAWQQRVRAPAGPAHAALHPQPRCAVPVAYQPRVARPAPQRPVAGWAARLRGQRGPDARGEHPGDTLCVGRDDEHRRAASLTATRQAPANPATTVKNRIRSIDGSLPAAV
jgi:hypothetical protein